MKYFLLSLLLYLLIPFNLFSNATNNSTIITLDLTKNEKVWLEKNPTLYVGMDSEYAPYEWMDKKGNYVGMAVDYLRLIEEKTGIHFEIVKEKSWSEVIKMAKKGEIDIVTSMVKTPDRLRYFSFSAPYRDTQTMIVDNGKGEFIGNLDHLKGKRVAVEEGYFIYEELSKKYPMIELVLAKNIVEALTFVKNGKADAYVGDISAINYAMKNNALESLRFSGQTEFLSQHCLAFSKESVELASIITKAMASISDEESNIIHSRWLGMRIEQGVSNETILKYSVGILCLFVLFCYWYYRLHSEMKHRKVAEMHEHYRNNILEMITKMEPLKTVLEAIIKGIEKQNPRMRCSILLLDKEGKLFSEVIAPSLPDFYNEAIKGISIGESVGSCGAAAYVKKRVIIEDIATHSSWKEYKDIALRADLKSCWSEPIVASEGYVLGILSIYHRTLQTPSTEDVLYIEQSTNLASIAIEKNIAASKLKESEALYRHLTEEVSDVIWKTDHNLNITYISPADEKFRGYRADEVVGHHVFEMFTQEGIDMVLEKIKQRHEAQVRGEYINSIAFEVQHKCKNGRLIWGEIIYHPELNYKGEIIGFHGITREITERKAVQDKIQQLAFYDPLTQLPNRLLLCERLRHTLADMKRNQKYSALFFIDLDNFKSLNDTKGHSIGDILLCQVADRLKKCIREVDTVVRFGGDEFVVILNTLHEDKEVSIKDAHAIAEKIRLSIAAVYLLRLPHDGEDVLIEHRCTASIGVLVFESEEGSQDDLLKRADTAMYQAKEAGRDRIVFYNSIQKA